MKCKIPDCNKMATNIVYAKNGIESALCPGHFADYAKEEAAREHARLVRELQEEFDMWEEILGGKLK